MITSGRDLKNTSCLSYYFCFDWSPEHLRANIHLRHAATKAPACHSKHVTVWRKVLSHDNLCNAVFIMLCRKMRQKKGLIFFFLFEWWRNTALFLLENQQSSCFTMQQTSTRSHSGAKSSIQYSSLSSILGAEQLYNVIVTNTPFNNRMNRWFCTSASAFFLCRQLTETASHKEL